MVTLNSQKSAILSGPRSIRIEHVSLPALGDTQVLVKLQGCGLCGSNLPVWQGRPWFNYPLEAGAPGHEGWGEVQAVGSEVSTLKLGDWVAMLSYHSFAEYDVAEEAQAVKVPTSLAQQPFPGEPLACAVNVFRRSDIQAGQTVVVVGLGFLGLLLTQLSVRAGARVIGISRRSYPRELAKDFGAVEVFSASDAPAVIGAVKELTRGAG